jgi:hypothetical protein
VLVFETALLTELFELVAEAADLGSNLVRPAVRDPLRPA